MSILAISAAPFDENYTKTSENGNPRRNRNRTLRRNQPSNRIQNIMDKLEPIDQDESMGTFSPPEFPVSIGANKREENDTISKLDDYEVTNDAFGDLPKEPDPIIPLQLAHSSGDKTISNKLDKMLYILEEQRDIRTQSVSEDVILYSFLGIFVIFLVDSFSKIEKYNR